jgi:hypothetical protein
MDIFDQDNEENSNLNITNIIENDDDNKIQLNNNSDNNRYINIIKLLGLNKNINYPSNIIINGIIEMHMIKIGNQSSNYARIYKWREDSTSKQINETLTGNTVNYQTSINVLNRLLKRIYRHFKYNNYVSKIDNIIDNNKNNNIISRSLAFNYDNPRWMPLMSYNLS